MRLVLSLDFRFVLILAGMALLCPPAGAVRSAKAPLSARARFVPGEVVVQYRPAASTQSIDRSLRTLGVVREKAIRYDRPSRIRLAAGAGIAAALARLRANPAVEYAEPNYYRYPQADRRVPNDPHFGEQWGWDNDGVAGSSLVDADMDMPEAWSIVTGAPAVTVAVIDDGFALDQPELADEFDPGGGIDCSGGTCTDGTTAARTDDAGDDDEDKDNQEHGTLVAGVIGADGNNGNGIAGIAWKVNLLPIKIDFTSASLAAAVRYAVDHNANIINMSLGGAGFSQAEFDALDYARLHNVLVVVAAGNYDSNIDESVASYPANYDLPNIIAAAASNSRDDIAHFSEWGSWSVDVAAPGEDVLTTNVDGGLSFASGTSFSSPATAGVAALVAQHLETGGALPGYREIKAHLLAGAEIAGSTGQSGFKGRVATGRVNAYNALTRPVDGGVIVIKKVTVDDDSALSVANDGDDTIDPGENVNLHITLENIWQGESDVRGTLISHNAFSTASPSQQDFGAMILPGQDSTADAKFPVTVGNFTGNQHLLFELDVTTASGKNYQRYFYLNVGHLDNDQPLTLEMERTDWDEFQNFHVDVPAGARDLVIFTRTDNGIDIDLLAHYGRPPHYNISLTVDSDSDDYRFFTDAGTLVSGNADGNESISVPQPSSGTYHVVAVNFAGSRHDYRIGACYAPPGIDQISFAGNVEVMENADSAALSLLRSGTHGAVSIDYATQDGSARSGVNYTPESGTIRWVDGDDSAKTITIPILNSGSIGADSSTFKNFHVMLSNPTGGANIGCIGSGEITLKGVDKDTSGDDASEPPPDTPPPDTPPESSDGGGGAVGLLFLFWLFGPLVRRYLRREHK